MRTLNIPQGRAHEAAACSRRRLADFAIDSLTARRDRISDHPKPTGDLMLDSLCRVDAAHLRLEAVTNPGIAEAFRKSIAAGMFAHDVDARMRRTDLTRGSDFIKDLLAGPDVRART